MTIIDFLGQLGPLYDCRTGEEKPLKQHKFKYLGLYFTAVWCGYCVKVVDRLRSAVEKVNSRGEYLKMITFRLDDAVSQNFGYSYLRYKGLEGQHVEQIARQLGARHIPSIYVFDLSGRLVTRSGLQDIMRHQEGTVDFWDKKMDQI